MKNKFLSILTAIAVAASLSACRAEDTGQAPPLIESVVSEGTIVEKPTGITEVQVEMKSNYENQLIYINGAALNFPCLPEEILSIDDDLKIEYSTIDFKDDVGVVFKNDNYICDITKNENGYINCIMFNPNDYISLGYVYANEIEEISKILDKYDETIYETTDGYMYKYIFSYNSITNYITIFCDSNKTIKTIALKLEEIENE